jgi:hypothetical protein
MANIADYKTNRYELSPELRDTITQRWGEVIRRYGYACDSDSRPKSGGSANRSVQAVSPLSSATRAGREIAEPSDPSRLRL